MSVKIAEGSDDEDVAEYKSFVKWVRLEYAKAMGTMDNLATAKAQMEAEIDRYDSSSAVNSFLLNGMEVWLDKATRVGLMNSTTIAKAMGKAKSTLWLGSYEL